MVRGRGSRSHTGLNAGPGPVERQEEDRVSQTEAELGAYHPNSAKSRPPRGTGNLSDISGLAWG